MAGLFDNLYNQDPNNQANLALAAGLLSGRGNLNNVMGGALLGGQKQYLDFLEAQRRNQLIQSQIASQQAESTSRETAAELKRQELGLEGRKLDILSQPKPSEGFTLGAGQKRFGPAGNILADNPSGVPVNDPSSIREWQYYNSLPPADQRRYLDMKRSNYGLESIGGVPSLVGKYTQPTVTPLSTLPAEASAAATKAGATETAKTAAEVSTKATETAKVDWPKARDAANDMINLLEGLKNHPGLDASVGMFSVLPRIPNTQQGDFLTRLDQVKGKMFMTAYESLKGGGGNISEIEGAKATDAIGRMNRAQTRRAFIQATNELEDIVKMGLERARKKAGAEASQAPASNVIDFNSLPK